MISVRDLISLVHISVAVRISYEVYRHFTHISTHNKTTMEVIFSCGRLYTVDLEINESSLEYNFGNALVVKTCLLEMECPNFCR